MLFERIVSPGLAHYSYLIGDKNQALVIDPRRDCQIYLEKASSEGMRIVYVLETHRNEDYAIGSFDLADRSGAEIWHADSQLDYGYGQAAKEGQTWKIGRLTVEAIHTPGHTPGSISYLLRDPAGVPWIIFTGDTLFAGDVGRIDLLGDDRSSEMAGLLYDSIFDKLMPLGEDLIICPAHGSGSVCGESISERLWSTIGIEKNHNPRLRIRAKDQFVADAVKINQERPPYFKMVEKFNLIGRSLLTAHSVQSPLAPAEFESIAEGAQILDTRMELSFGAAHIPGAQFIWREGLASFAGWYLSYECPILLVSEANNPSEDISTLARLGFDNIAGYLAGGMLNWHMSGRNSASIATVNVKDFCRLLDISESLYILDVRSEKELQRDGQIPGAKHVHVTQIPGRMEEISKERSVYVFCGSGMRSMIAASYLQLRGWKDLQVVLGGLAGWRSIKCPIEK